MAFPESFLQELAERNDIVDVVGSYVRLTKKSGSNLFGLCPFHSEKTPSFSVSPDKQIYHCFGCGKGGSVISFIMEIENLSFPEAVAFLANRAGMQLPEQADDPGAKKRQRLLALNRDAARFFHAQLKTPAGQIARDYLARRQLTAQTVTRFGLGFAPDTWDSLVRAMKALGYSEHELFDGGLVRHGKSGGVYDTFRNRLMFPVIDVRGNVIGFSGRILGDGEPKYMNSPETIVFSKSHNLFALNLAKKSKCGYIILAEGNIDVASLHQAGFDNAVASMGTALTVEQTRLLSRFTKELVLCYDNDNAGKIATERALQILNGSEFSVKVLQLPRRLVDGEYIKQDADDFIKFQGPDAFERLLNGSENGVEFRMAQIAGKYDLKDDEARIAYCGEVSELLASLPGAVEREIYTGRAAEAAGITAEAMKLEVQRSFKRRIAREKRAELRKDLNPAMALQPKERSLRFENMRSAEAEKGILRLLLTDDTLFSDTIPIPPERFSSPLLSRAYQRLWEVHAAGSRPMISSLGEEFSREEIDCLTAVCQEPVSTQHAQQALTDYIDVINSEADKRTAQDDPLLAAVEKFKNKKRGKQHV